jgi:hypothetical protein
VRAQRKERSCLHAVMVRNESPQDHEEVIQTCGDREDKVDVGPDPARNVLEARIELDIVRGRERVNRSSGSSVSLNEMWVP